MLQNLHFYQLTTSVDMLSDIYNLYNNTFIPGFSVAP